MLKIENLKKTFLPGTINEKKVFDGLNLTIEDGDFVTVIGSNGAGKSTLLNAIAGSFNIDDGKIFIDDVDITKFPEYKRAQYIGRVFQDPMTGTASDMWIEENLALANRRGNSRSLKQGITNEERKIYKDLLADFDLGLEDRLDTKVGTLSGGQRQAITLLMATIKKPKILLLDEHTAALDPKTAKKVLEITDKVVKKNKLTTFMVTHNMKDAITHGNRLIMMDSGKIVLDIKGKEKKELTVEKLLERFNIVNDAMILKK